jgi:hypothetical protein
MSRGKSMGESYGGAILALVESVMDGGGVTSQQAATTPVVGTAGRLRRILPPPRNIKIQRNLAEWPSSRLRYRP